MPVSYAHFYDDKVAVFETAPAANDVVVLKTLQHVSFLQSFGIFPTASTLQWHEFKNDIEAVDVFARFVNDALRASAQHAVDGETEDCNRRELRKVVG